MAFSNPFPITNASISYDASPLYGFFQDLLTPGVVAGTTGFVLSQHSGAANFSPDVSAGVAYVPSTGGGVYRVVLGTVSNAVTTPADWANAFTAADATNPRVDTVYVKLNDSNIDSSGLYSSQLAVAAGTPTGGATLTNLTGKAALPANALLIGYCLVPALATTITTANIKDARVYAKIGGQAATTKTGIATTSQLLTGSTGVDATHLTNSPLDGDELYLNVGSTSVAGGAVVWKFRYQANDTSGFPWYYVGGAPISAVAAGSYATTNTAFGVPTTSPGNVPTITVPRTGYYIIEVSAQLANSTAADGCQVAPHTATLVPVIGNSVRHISAAAAPGNTNVMGISTVPLLLQKGETLDLQIMAITGGTGTCAASSINLQPVQVI